MEGAGRRGVDGLEGRRGLSGWRDRTARTQPHKPNCNKNRTETEAKPVPETETNRNEPWLYCRFGMVIYQGVMTRTVGSRWFITAYPKITCIAAGLRI